MKILAIDIGNTFLKLGVFHNNFLLEKYVVTHSQLPETTQKINQTHPEIEKAVVCAVGRFPQNTQRTLADFWEVFKITSDFPVSFQINYETPKTLGVDRLVLAAAAYNQFPNKNVLIIDAGTCITYDFMDEHGVYQGGAISPGVRLRYKSLNDYTQQLPLLDASAPKHLIGKSTESSIHSGVINGIVFEIDGVIANYKLLYKDLTVILTGGNTDFLQDKLKNSIFANSNFLLEGLNFLSDFIKSNDI
ncbi:MAG TPA: type III pantothenate kinase [Flavobacteriaceae bacterium]|nr:type III pantothenate kinase [Flavobacteriaceae bacterium]